MARRIADLLARLNPEAPPLLRLQLAHWLARRIVAHRSAMPAAAGQRGQKQLVLTDISPSDYEI